MMAIDGLLADEVVIIEPMSVVLGVEPGCLLMEEHGDLVERGSVVFLSAPAVEHEIV